MSKLPNGDWFPIAKRAAKKLRNHRAPPSARVLYMEICRLKNEKCNREDHPEDWFAMSDEKMAEACAMTERTVKIAKKILVALQLIEAETKPWYERGAAKPSRMRVTVWRIRKC
jgi:hypothetical protein